MQYHEDVSAMSSDHLHIWTLLFLQLGHVDQVVLRRLAVCLTKVQFHCVLARKGPVAELTLECGAHVFLCSPQWAQGLAHEDFGDALLLLNLTEWQLGEVLQAEAQVCLQMADVRGSSSELRGTIVAKENRMPCVEVLEEFCSPCPSQLVLHIGQPVADGGHGEARELGDVHALLRAQVRHDVLALRCLPQTRGKLGLQDEQVLWVPVGLAPLPLVDR